MPGMINVHDARRHAAVSRPRAGDRGVEAHRLGPEFVRDGTLAAIAEMLQVRNHLLLRSLLFSRRRRRSAADEQGMRAMIGMPVADGVTPWAKDCRRNH